MKTTIPLELAKYRFAADYYTKSGWLALCVSKVRQLWDIPKGTKEIDVILSSTPMTTSYEIRFDLSAGDVMVYHSGKWNRYGLYHYTRNLLHEFMLQTGKEILYVKIRY